MSLTARILYVFLATFVHFSTAQTADCLSVARKLYSQLPHDLQVKNWVEFYSYISAVYTQIHTNNASKYADDFDLLTIDTEIFLHASKGIDEDLLSFLQEIFSAPKDNQYHYWLQIIQKSQALLEELHLRTPEGIRKIHDAATYFDIQHNTPPLCLHHQLPSPKEARRILNDYQKNVSEKIVFDPRFILVSSFRKNLWFVDDPALKMGGEIELFHIDYFDLFKEFISDDRLREIVQAGEFPPSGFMVISESVPKMKKIEDKNDEWKPDVSQISSLENSLPKGQRLD